MTIKQALHHARELLVANNIEDASLESEILLRHALHLSRVQLYQRLDGELIPEQQRVFHELLQRRLAGEPATYIIGHREFYGLDFYVDTSVLIPRPETELLVEKALALAQKQSISTIADVGTGCGAIAISLALELTQTKIYATDISAAALEVARFNCQQHGVQDRIHLLQGNLIDALPEHVDLIVANPPYVKKRDLTCQSGFEPGLALDGGDDGLEKVRQLCRQANGKLNAGGCLMVEIGQGQHEAVTNLLRRLFPSAQIEVTPDPGGIERVVSLNLSPEAVNQSHVK